MRGNHKSFGKNERGFQLFYRTRLCRNKDKRGTPAGCIPQGLEAEARTANGPNRDIAKGKSVPILKDAIIN